ATGPSRPLAGRDPSRRRAPVAPKRTGPVGSASAPKRGRAGSVARGGVRPAGGSGRVGEPRRGPAVLEPGNCVSSAPAGTGADRDTVSGPGGQRSGGPVRCRSAPWAAALDRVSGYWDNRDVGGIEEESGAQGATRPRLRAP